MADQDNYKTYVRETHTTDRSGSGTALLVGGLIVAVGFILWFIFGAVVPTSTAPVENDTTNVTVEPATPDAATPDAAVPAEPQTDAVTPDAGADTAPATPDAADPAPADPAADPAAPVEPAPAD